MVMLACNAGETVTPAPFEESPWVKPLPALIISPEALPEAEAGKPYEVILQISQNETPVNGYKISAGGLPEGLEITFPEDTGMLSTTGTISGIPREAGTYHFTVFVWCVGTYAGGQTADREYTLVIR